MSRAVGEIVKLKKSLKFPQASIIDDLVGKEATILSSKPSSMGKAYRVEVNGTRVLTVFDDEIEETE